MFSCIHFEGDLALRLKKNGWAKEFIETHKNELSLDDSENFYSLALYEFAEGNYENVLKLLSKVAYTETYHKTDMKCLQAAVYFELTDTLLAHLDSFRYFLSNNKVLPHNRKVVLLGFYEVGQKPLCTAGKK